MFPQDWTCRKRSIQITSKSVREQFCSTSKTKTVFPKNYTQNPHFPCLEGGVASPLPAPLGGHLLWQSTAPLRAALAVRQTQNPAGHTVKQTPPLRRTQIQAVSTAPTVRPRAASWRCKLGSDRPGCVHLSILGRGVFLQGSTGFEMTVSRFSQLPRSIPSKRLKGRADTERWKGRRWCGQTSRKPEMTVT